MLRLKTLLTRTDMARHLRKRKNPVISKITKSVLAMDESGLFLMFQGKAVDLYTNKDHNTRAKHGPYYLLAKLYYNDDQAKMHNPKCLVHCNCADFTYRCEVALAIRGSSVIVNSNGALPHQTNPNAVPHVCKHALSFLEKCVAKTNKGKPEDHAKEPVHVRSDRALIQSLQKPRKNPVNLKRMFRNYFNANMVSTRL